MYIGTNSFASKSFAEFEPYQYDENSCRGILFWLATSNLEVGNSGMSVSYSQTLYELFEGLFVCLFVCVCM